jgi:hypothetical protein
MSHPRIHRNKYVTCFLLTLVVKINKTQEYTPIMLKKYNPIISVCFFVLCNRHWFNKAPGPDPRGTELRVTYLPSAFSSDASCADLPLPLLGAPVSIGALVKLGSRSLAKQDRDWSSRPPGTGLHVPVRRHRGSAAIHPSWSRD